MTDSKDGLKVKYDVFKVGTNIPVDNCFVLRPDKDPAAFRALMSYANTTENKKLAADIIRWLQSITYGE